MTRPCKHYKIYTWSDPPLAPGEDSRVYTETECTNTKGYFVPGCGGDKKLCDLPENKGRRDDDL